MGDVSNAPAGLPVAAQSAAQPADTVVVGSALYHYAIATRGGAIVQASPSLFS